MWRNSISAQTLTSPVAGILQYTYVELHTLQVKIPHVLMNKSVSMNSYIFSFIPTALGIWNPKKRPVGAQLLHLWHFLQHFLQLLHAWHFLQHFLQLLYSWHFLQHFLILRNPGTKKKLPPRVGSQLFLAEEIRQGVYVRTVWQITDPILKLPFCFFESGSDGPKPTWNVKKLLTKSTVYSIYVNKKLLYDFCDLFNTILQSNQWLTPVK